MKKEYIRPESRLFTINLAEKIADGSVIKPGSGTGSQLVDFIFTQVLEGCIENYSGYEYAPVVDGHVTKMYLEEIITRYPAHLLDILTRCKP